MDDNTFAKQFGENLRALRKGYGMTQDQLAREIGVSKSSINMYERGEREPGLFVLKKIVEHYGVSFEMLISPSELAAFAENRGDDAP